MKRNFIILALLTLSLTSCSDRIAIGEERIYCKNCTGDINPFDNNGTKVTVLNKRGGYVQYVTEKGDTLSSRAESFNDNTYVNGKKVGNLNEFEEFLITFILVLFVMCIVIGLLM